MPANAWNVAFSEVIFEHPPPKKTGGKIGIRKVQFPDYLFAVSGCGGTGNVLCSECGGRGHL